MEDYESCLTTHEKAIGCVATDVSLDLLVQWAKDFSEATERVANQNLQDLKDRL